MARSDALSRVRGAAGAFTSNWCNPDLRRTQLGFAGAWTAEWAFTVGLGVYAYRHGGATAVGLVALLRILPAAVLAPFASVLADRGRRERLLVAISAVRGAASAGAAALVGSDGPVGLVYLLAVVSTIAAVLYRPVHSALLPSLCRSPAELAGANVVRGMLDSLATLVGPAVAAVLLANSDVTAVFAAVAALSWWSAALTLRVRTDALPPSLPTSPGRSSRGPAGRRDLGITKGLAAIRADADLALLIGLTGLQTATRGALTVLTVVVAIDLLDMGESGAGTLSGAVGAVAGSFAASVLVGTHGLARWFGVGVALWGAPLVALGLAPGRASAVALLAVIGMGNALVDIGLFTLVARLAPEEVLGRVFGALECVVALAVGLGSVAVPLAIDGLGLRGALIAIGLVGPVSVALCWQRLRRLDLHMVTLDREVDLLRTVPMLSLLPLPAIERLAGALEPVDLPAGAVVFEQGAPGDRCFVVVRGDLDVVGDGRRVAVLGPGELFGEIALLREVPRTATVRATTDVRLESLTSARFLPIVTGYRSSADEAGARVDELLRRWRPVEDA